MRWSLAVFVTLGWGSAQATPGPMSEGLPACPAPDPTARAAAHTLVDLVRTLTGPAAANAASAELYRVAADGASIELVDGAGVTDAARGVLAMGQEDPVVAAYLVHGLRACQSRVQSGTCPRLGHALVAALASGRGASSVSWCGASLTEVVSTDAAPLVEDVEGCSPFDRLEERNAYFIVASDHQVVDGAVVQRVRVDPSSYTDPAASYDAEGWIGSENNPHEISGGLYAVPEHETEWARRTNSSTGNVEMGDFTTKRLILGQTWYLWRKRYCVVSSSGTTINAGQPGCPL